MRRRVLKYLLDREYDAIVVGDRETELYYYNARVLYVRNVLGLIPAGSFDGL